MYDMLGNAWEWVSDEFKDKGRETKYVLRGGSYIDTANGKHNHKVTVTTRYVKVSWKILHFFQRNSKFPPLKTILH